MYWVHGQRVVHKYMHMDHYYGVYSHALNMYMYTYRTELYGAQYTSILHNNF